MNKDKLSKIMRKKYDLIFFRSTLNFNYNFKSLVYEIKNLSKKIQFVYSIFILQV